jgi:hypothetical protein
MRTFCFWIALCMVTSFHALAQDADTEEESFWKTGGEFNFTFQQVALSNWAGGGRSSLALGGVMSTYLTYDDTTSRRWENRLEVSYGISKIGDDNDRFIKTKDNLIFTSRYGRKLSSRLYLSGLIDFRSQIAQGFKFVQLNDSVSDAVLASEFMAPGFLVTSLGLTYSPKKRNLIEEDKKAQKQEGNYFALTLSPFSGKFTFVLNDDLVASEQYNTEGKSVKAEAGSSLTVSLRRKIWENVIFNTNLNLFSAFENFQNVDVNLESLLILKVNKYIMSNISLQLIYDDDINVQRDDGTQGPALQMQNAINVGFSYGF